MAKTDFCFTYYDGDAARDMAHMNRLERGGYGDLIISQRKFGHLSLDRIKKTLGKDFPDIWDCIELVLVKDENGDYYIEWQEETIQKRQRQARHQSENGKLGGRPKKPNETQSKANQKPNKSKKKPLGDGDESGDEIEIGNRSGNE